MTVPKTYVEDSRLGVTAPSNIFTATGVWLPDHNINMVSLGVDDFKFVWLIGYIIWNDHRYLTNYEYNVHSDAIYILGWKI